MSNGKQHVLIVEDDDSLARVLSLSLGKIGCESSIAGTGHEALKLAYRHRPDLVIMDVMLPQLDGWETCRRLKSAADVPVLMMSCRTSESDVLTGFQAGADDYVRKPFTLGEMTARVQALLRRSRADAAASAPLVFHAQDLTVDLALHRATQASKELDLTPTEFHLLSYLIQHAGRVVPHRELLTEIWGPSCAGEKPYLMYYVRFLRRKLGDDASSPRYIQTVRSRGYRLRT